MEAKTHTKQNSVHVLTESAIMIALSTVLSILKIAEMPYGGSVTVASALPIAIIAYRYGLKTGLFAGTVHAALQLVLGLSALSYATNWQSAVAIIALDYILAFMFIGVAGIFRKPIKNQAAALTAGVLLYSVIRYIFHVIAGATVWAGISVPTAAALAYSFIYNATYMIPETIVLAVATLYVGSVIDFRFASPRRIARGKAKGTSAWMPQAAALAVCAAIIFNVAEIFEKLQDAETGEFTLATISDVNWLAVVIVSALALVLAAVLLILHKSIKTMKE
ncbi:MAG: energy-coupled thiamine transporter ThiT [Clostridia bacterium]|nr:energy-coupled thiamine transporter ThiT [Clostridia bacterium]